MAKVLFFGLLLFLLPVQTATAAEELENREGRVSINGVDHWYRIAGAANGGVPIVVVHGGPGGNVYNFERTIGPRLERFATIVYYEQRGSGRSGRPADDGAYSIELITTDLHALLDALDLEKVILLGFSFGGELALEYAVRHPRRVEKLILSSTSAGDHERMATVQTWGWLMIHEGEARAKLEALARRPVKSAFKRLNELWSLADADLSDRFLFHSAEAAKKNRRLWAESGLENTGLMARALLDRPSRRSPSLMDDIRRLDIPALVIAGLHDRNIGVDMIRDIAQSLPDAQFILFENSAHFPDIEEPEKFADVVKTFVAE